MSEKEFESKKKSEKKIERQPEFDYCKTLGIFLMISLHVYDNYSKGYIYHIVDFLSFILGAAGFMILMGMAVKYSRHQSPKQYIFRGLALLTIGQYVNLIRNTLPNMIAW